MKSIVTKFLLPVLILAVVFVSLYVQQDYRDTRREVAELMERQAAMALAFDLAIRSYVAEEIRGPHVAELVNIQRIDAAHRFIDVRRDAIEIAVAESEERGPHAVID